MSFLKNRHVVIAMLVAPLLALGSYFALDFLVGEKPEPAEAGQSYPLAERPNCRYSSGNCGLVNGDFELQLSTREASAGRLALVLSSAFPLDGVMVALVDASTGEGDAPTPMQAAGSEGTEWTLEIGQPNPERHRLRLVASAAGTLYFGEAATKFTAPDPDSTSD